MVSNPILVFARSHLGIDVVESSHGSVAVYSNARPDSDLNEDAAAVIHVSEEALVLAVADGAGGMRQGHMAARIAIEALQKTLTHRDESTLDLRGPIIDAFEMANAAILDKLNGAGTTLAVVEIIGNRMRPYHVGDSTILLTGQRGAVKFRSTPHSPVGYALQSGLVNEKEAMQDEDSHLVYNLVGTKDMSIEIGPPITLAARDTLLIASDGLTDNLPIDVVIESIRKGNLAKGCQQLMTQCRKVMEHGSTIVDGHPDDLTALVFRPKLTVNKKQSSPKSPKVA